MEGLDDGSAQRHIWRASQKPDRIVDAIPSVITGFSTYTISINHAEGQRIDDFNPIFWGSCQYSTPFADAVFDYKLKRKLTRDEAKECFHLAATVIPINLPDSLPPEPPDVAAIRKRFDEMGNENHPNAGSYFDNYMLRLGVNCYLGSPMKTFLYVWGESNSGKTTSMSVIRTFLVSTYDTIRVSELTEDAAKRVGQSESGKSFATARLLVCEEVQDADLDISFIKERTGGLYVMLDVEGKNDKRQTLPLRASLIMMGERINPTLNALKDGIANRLDAMFLNAVSYTHLTLPTNREV